MDEKILYEVYKDFGNNEGELKLGIYSTLENAEYVKDYYSNKYNTNDIYIRDIELDLTLDLLDEREYTLKELGKQE